MRKGTRPHGRRGTGAWSPDGLAHEIGVSRRTIDNYGNGSTLPPDATPFAEAFFGDDPRHTTKRNAFLIAFAEVTGTEPPTWAFATSNVPIRVPTHFMGRDQALEAIRTAIGRYAGRVAITALHGMRGVGKTVLAAAYAERHRSDYRATWWIRGETEPTLRADLAALGVRLGWISADEEEARSLDVVMERLRHEGDGILLIYDNAANARHLTPYLPRGGAAQVLVTSNAHAWRGVAEPIEIRVWPTEVGADYLVARLRRGAAERDDAEELSESLGGLPLAHEQAAAYCERLDVSLAEYGRRFAATPTRLLGDQLDAPVDYYGGLTVAKTFSLAIQEAARLHPAAEPLVLHAAMLAAEPIPLFLLTEGKAAFGEPLTSMLAGDGLDEAIAALRTFALVEREAITDERDSGMTTDTIRLHRLVREVAAARLTAETREGMRRALITAMVTAYPAGVFDNPRSWPRARRLDAPALAMVGSEEGIPEGAEEPAIKLLDHLASFRQGSLGTYLLARPLFERALAISEVTFGADHPRTAECLNNLGNLLQRQGAVVSARSLYERSLAINEATLGPNHEETGDSLNNLALVLCEQGELNTAQSLFERALKIRQVAFGPDHPRTATILTNLGCLLHERCDFLEARGMFDEALRIRGTALGPDHPDTATTVSHLARLLYGQGDCDGARQLFERALRIRESALGLNHPRTAISLDDLAGLLRGQGDSASARPLFERALAIRESVFGPSDLKTAASIENLASSLEEHDELPEARRLFKRAEAIRDKAGPCSKTPRAGGRFH